MKIRNILLQKVKKICASVMHCKKNTSTECECIAKIYGHTFEISPYILHEIC